MCSCTCPITSRPYWLTGVLTTTPIVLVRCVRIARAVALGTNPVSLSTTVTASRVLAETLGWPLRTRETVLCDTPEILAMSRLVRPVRPFSIDAYLTCVDDRCSSPSGQRLCQFLPTRSHR